jgi:hypothetical protein
MIRRENAHFIHYRQRRCAPYSGYPWVIERDPVELICGTPADFNQWTTLVLGPSVRHHIATVGMEQVPLLLGRDDRGRCWWGFRERFYSTGEGDLDPDEVKVLIEASDRPTRHSRLVARAD